MESVVGKNRAGKGPRQLVLPYCVGNGCAGCWQEVDTDGSVAGSAGTDEGECIVDYGVVRDALGPVNKEGGVVYPLGVRTCQVAGKEGAGVGRNKAGIERKFPVKYISVVVCPAVHNLNIPVAVEWTADKRGKTLVGVVEV